MNTFWVHSRILPIIFALWAVGLAFPHLSEASHEHSFPKTANIFLKWDLNKEDVAMLSQYELLILDMEVGVETPNRLRSIRKRNPDIIILAYVTSQEIMEWTVSLSKSSLRRKLWDQIDPSWFMRDKNGKIIRYWPKSLFINVTNRAPIMDGKRWNMVLPKFMHDEVMSTGFWDGIFYDNAWDSVQFVNNGSLDLDADGVFESNEKELNADWIDGMKTLLKTSRKLEGKKAIIIGNGGDEYSDILNGRMIESFPLKEEGDWSGSMRAYMNDGFSHEPYSIINVSDSRLKKNTLKFRFGLASALMGNGYYSFDNGPIGGHSVNWWFDEWSIDLGNARGEAESVFDWASAFSAGVYKRDFENGVAFVNATKWDQTIDLKGKFETIKGDDDPFVNTGEFIDKLILQPFDGRALLRPLQFLNGVVLENGLRTQILNSKGEPMRKEFTAFDPKAIPSATIVRIENNQGKIMKTIQANGSAITVLEPGKISRFFPFGKEYKGTLNIAFEKTKNGDFGRFLVSGAKGGGPHIRIFDENGKMIHNGFFAFNQSSRNGVSIAFADVNDDGKQEIIAGSPKGTIPMVRIFDDHGNVINPGFLVFDKEFRGGVSVAGFQERSNAKVSIVVGPANGGGPHIRFFRSNGNLVNPGFYVFEPYLSGGIRLESSDVNRDGKNELIVQANSEPN